MYEAYLAVCLVLYLGDNVVKYTQDEIKKYIVNNIDYLVLDVSASFDEVKDMNGSMHLYPYIDVSVKVMIDDLLETQSEPPVVKRGTLTKEQAYEILQSDMKAKWSK